MTKSKLPRKQRKARSNASANKRRKLISSHLCGEPGNDLIKRYNIRSLPVCKGDLVRVVRGDAEFLGKEMSITEIFTKDMKIGLEGVNLKKADKSEVTRKVDPSNVIIIRLNLSDPWRRKKLEMLSGGVDI